MPIIKSAAKRMRQTAKRRERNINIKKSIKTAVKSLSDKPTSAALSRAQSELDKAVKKGLLKKNTAARRKAALAKRTKLAGVKLTSTAKKVVKKATTAKSPTKSTTARKTATKKTITKKPAAKKSTT
jgi:ribosomal protein S20